MSEKEITNHGHSFVICKILSYLKEHTRTGGGTEQ